MDKKIIEAIQNNEIGCAIQKILNVESGKKDKCEILARLKVDGQAITPDIFIPLAKKANVYKYITRSVIEKSFAYMAKEEEIKEFSINLNMLDINNDDTIKYLIDKICYFNLQEKIVIELTEDEELTKKLKPEADGKKRGIDKVHEVMDKLHKMGCKFALDDFGKGYATFDPLINLKFDYIKLDAVLTKEFLNDGRKFYMINLLSEYSKRLGLFIVAEYIENEDEYKAMDYMKVDYLQGYHIDKPKLIETRVQF